MSRKRTPKPFGRARRMYLTVFTDLLPRAAKRLAKRQGGVNGHARDELDDPCVAVPFYRETRRFDELSLAVVCHLFYPDMTDWLVSIVARIDRPVHLYLSTDTEEKVEAITAILDRTHAGGYVIRLAENRGRDIAPKLITFADVYDRHDLVLFLHSKQSPHYGRGSGWRDMLIEALAGSRETVGNIIGMFDERPDLGIVTPQHFAELREDGHITWGGTLPQARRLAWRMGFDIALSRPMDFASGSMFWARPAALRPLLDLKLRPTDFPIEGGQTNGTVAHAIERLFFYSAELAGYRWVKVVGASDVRRYPSARMPASLRDFAALLDGDRFALLDRR